MSQGQGVRRGRRLGDYYRSGDWSDYFQTAVSKVEPGKILIRGYPIEEIIAQLSYAELVYLTIRGNLPTKAQGRVVEAALCSIPAHQWVASHLLSAAVVASAFPESPIPGIAAGVLTAGSNTVSPQDAALVVDEVRALMRDEGCDVATAAARLVEVYRGAGRLIPGLGHPIEKENDLRSTALAKVAKEQGTWGEACEIYAAVQAAFVAATGKHLPINIDGMLGSVLADLGFTPFEMAGIAAMAVMPGIVAYVIEEITSGVPLRVVPDVASKYVGPPERHLPPRV